MSKRSFMPISALCGLSALCLLRAADPAPALAQGSACRIFTGAPIPPRANAVIMQENCAREGGALHFEMRPKAGQRFERGLVVGLVV